MRKCFSAPFICTSKRPEGCALKQSLGNIHPGPTSSPLKIGDNIKPDPFKNQRVRPWICCQIGAREHYAIPRALHPGGQLAALYTDFWAGAAVRKLAGRSGVRPLRSLATRFHPELAGAPVGSWNIRSWSWEARLRYLSRQNHSTGRFAGYIEVGRRFAGAVRASLQQRRDLAGNTILFAYDTGALEILEWCRERGIKCVLNQIDPNRIEVELVGQEEQRWPGWALEAVQVSEEYVARREREWALADRILVNSEFCRGSLVKQGVPPEKLVVVPLCYEAEPGGNGDERSKMENGSASGPLRVLFLGQVILRKGIQYLIAAARQLERENIHFDVVGPVGISTEAMATAPRNMTFHGRAGRDQTAAWYRRSHLFVLPTLSDGFAITQLEAMAHGVPVIATTCCGEVVSHGMDGFVVPPSDAAALVQAFQRYLLEPALLPEQRKAALEKSKQFTLGRLTANLEALEAAFV